MTIDVAGDVAAKRRLNVIKGLLAVPTGILVA